MKPGGMYNFHPGSHVEQGVETGVSLIAQMLNNKEDEEIQKNAK
jgi:deoxyribonuclease-4